MTKYYISYGTGAGDISIKGTLEEAKKAADEGASYTQEDIGIYDGDVEITRRIWWGVKLSEDDDVEDPICVGDYGYYGDWS